MIENLLTEQRNPLSAHIDTLPTEAVLRIINEEDQKVAAIVAHAIPAISHAVDKIAARLRDGGRLLYIGAGTSGRLGVLDASECPPTFSVSYDLVQGIMAGGPTALYQATEANEDDAESGARDLLERKITRADVVAGIAASGRTPYVLGAVREARDVGALTVGISCSPASELSAAVDLPIEVFVGPEVITGSTRMKAGTATKLILNMISTATMIRRFVYENLMVNVAPRNQKLRDRAMRIVRQAVGVDTARASGLLAEAGSVKTAIVMGKRNLSRAAAEAELERAGGIVGKALEL
ncbi:MAG: N-acetylmuramic acid 6-phosphate etherase [Bryobacteraceae bacterium]